MSTQSTRRTLLQSGAVAAAASLGACAADSGASKEPEWSQAVNGRIKHSVCFWCFSVPEWGWDLEKLCSEAAALGMKSVELLNPEQWATAKKHGLTCAIANNGMADPPFMKGLNNPRYQQTVIDTTKKTIDACAADGIPSTIAFTGYKWNDAEDPSSGEISREEGFKNTVAGLKELATYAEEKGVTVNLEMLNTRDGSHPMKGHPGFQGDDIDYCADMIREVNSPRVKLLFDIYHVQIMNGDVIRRIHEMKDLIGHIHTAGNPGRAELHFNSEINYPAIMEALVEVGYDGYVGHEFIPTQTPEEGLAAAVKLCDV